MLPSSNIQEGHRALPAQICLSNPHQICLPFRKPGPSTGPLCPSPSWPDHRSGHLFHTHPFIHSCLLLCVCAHPASWISRSLQASQPAALSGPPLKGRQAFPALLCRLWFWSTIFPPRHWAWVHELRFQGSFIYILVFYQVVTLQANGAFQLSLWRVTDTQAPASMDSLRSSYDSDP